MKLHYQPTLTVKKLKTSKKNNITFKFDSKNNLRNSVEKFAKTAKKFAIQNLICLSQNYKKVNIQQINNKIGTVIKIENDEIKN